MTSLSLRLVLSTPLGALALSLVAACGGSSGPDGSGGSGGSGAGSSNAALCGHVCASILACVKPADCTLVSPAGAATSCAASCEGGYTGLTATEASLVDACFQCTVKAAAGQCVEQANNACASACNSAAAKAAGDKWSAAFGTGVSGSGAKCTNGMDSFGGSCNTQGDESGCMTSCQNAGSATPDVSAYCSNPNAPGPTTTYDCTCGAGKNKGKTFMSPDCLSAGTVWNQCNL